MNLDLTDEQQLLVDTLGRLLDGVTAERLRAVWGVDHLRDEYALLESMGLVELVASGEAPVETALIGEALGRRGAITPLASAALCGRADGLWTLASSVPGEREFLSSASAVAPLGGERCHVQFAAQADGFLVPGRDGVLAVAAGAAGVEVVPTEVLGGVPTGRVTFTEATPFEVVADGADLLPRRWASALLLQAGYLVGAAGRLLELTRDHVLERRQFGVPLGTFQVVKHHLADGKIGVDGARLMVLHTACLGSSHPDGLALAAEAKAWAAEVAHDVARWAHELHGGISVVDEHDVSLLSRRIIAEASTYGSPRQLWAVAGAGLARSVVGIPA